MKRYRIGVHGCDDSTCFDIELTDEEANGVSKIAERSEQVSTYGCMPIVEIQEEADETAGPTTGSAQD